MHAIPSCTGLGNVKTGQMKEVSGRKRRRRRSHSEDSEEELSAKMIKEQVTAVHEINMVGFLTHTKASHCNLLFYVMFYYILTGTLLYNLNLLKLNNAPIMSAISVKKQGKR